MGPQSNGMREVISDDTIGSRMQEEEVCDACPYCDDVCNNPCCHICSRKRETSHPGRYTRCQIRRHSSPESCWLVAGSTVYDVTRFIPRHPAGTFSIVRHAGGRDCSEDLAFHSTKAQKLWSHHKIGKLVLCPTEQHREGTLMRRWFPSFFPNNGYPAAGGHQAYVATQASGDRLGGK